MTALPQQPFVHEHRRSTFSTTYVSAGYAILYGTWPTHYLHRADCDWRLLLDNVVGCAVPRPCPKGGLQLLLGRSAAGRQARLHGQRRDRCIQRAAPTIAPTRTRLPLQQSTTFWLQARPWQRAPRLATPANVTAAHTTRCSNASAVSASTWGGYEPRRGTWQPPCPFHFTGPFITWESAKKSTNQCSPRTILVNRPASKLFDTYARNHSQS